MIFRYSSLLLLVAALVVVGCDQGNQAPDFSTGDTYIINQEGSSVGDASKDSVTVPDSVDYFVQAFTVDKEYTWTVNGSEPPVQTQENQTHVWSEEKRGLDGEGEFITVVYGPNDPLAPTDAPTTTQSITVDAQLNDGSDDGVDARTIEVEAVIPNVAQQVGRLPGFGNLAGLATTSGVAGALGADPITLLAPRNASFPPRNAPEPTQATDSDEPVTSSVLGDLLKYHAIPADVASSDITDGQTPQTLLGDQEVTFTRSNGEILINGGPHRVVKPDVPVINGAFHGIGVNDAARPIDSLLTPSTASVDFTDRSFDQAPAAGDTVTVNGSFFPEDGGFIVLHDRTERANQGAIPSIIGTSEFVPEGINNEVKVVLDEAISDTTAVEAMAHEDDGNEQFDFVNTGGTVDRPFLLGGEIVLDVGVISVPSN